MIHATADRLALVPVHKCAELHVIYLMIFYNNYSTHRNKQKNNDIRYILTSNTK